MENGCGEDWRESSKSSEQSIAVGWVRGGGGLDRGGVYEMETSYWIRHLFWR